jgi:uncharacterized protein (DUF885 family)
MTDGETGGVPGVGGSKGGVPGVGGSKGGVPGVGGRARLHRLFEETWADTMAEDPEWATVIGYPGYDDRWADVSAEGHDRRLGKARSTLRALAAFTDDALDDVDRVSRDVLARQCREQLDGARFHLELLPLNQLMGVQQDPAMVIEAQPAGSPEERERIVERLRRLPRVVDDTIDNLRRGLAAGITPPQICLRDVPQQIRNQLVADPLESPLLVPFRAADADAVRDAAAEAYSAHVVPAFERLHSFVVDTYLPGARSTIACRDLPDGPELYEHLVGVHTTTSMTAEEIHEIGRSEVDRIRAEMERVVHEAGFDDFAGYSRHLRTSPDQHHETAEALLDGYRDIARRVSEHLPRLFGRLPRIPFEIVPVPPYAEQSQTAAYYLPGSPDPVAGRPGQFFANTYDLLSRFVWEMEALTLHEAVPGHHLQIALAQELDELPEFRRNIWLTAYGEGWGLYAESLGPEVGCYQDPASRFGALIGEIWRAVRLVVDTGLHAFGWTREEAIAYFEETTGRPGDHDIVVEIDRYIVWPGQALGYKIGELEIKALRARAAAELGGRFDLRGFHDEVLRHGCLPLDVLARQVDGWIASA